MTTSTHSHKAWANKGCHVIVTREFTAKREEEVFKRKLMTMLTTVHVENVGKLLGTFEPVRRHFNDSNDSDPPQHN